MNNNNVNANYSIEIPNTPIVNSSPNPNGFTFMPSYRLIRINSEQPESIDLVLTELQLTRAQLSEQLTTRLNQHHGEDIYFFDGDFLVIDYPNGPIPGAGIVGYYSVIADYSNLNYNFYMKYDETAFIAEIQEAVSFTSLPIPTNFPKPDGTFYTLSEFIENKLFYFKETIPTVIDSVNKFALHNISFYLNEYGKINEFEPDYIILYFDEISGARKFNDDDGIISVGGFLKTWKHLLNSEFFGYAPTSYMFIWNDEQSTQDIYRHFNLISSNAPGGGAGFNLGNLNESYRTTPATTPTASPGTLPSGYTSFFSSPVAAEPPNPVGQFTVNSWMNASTIEENSKMNGSTGGKRSNAYRNRKTKRRKTNKKIRSKRRRYTRR